MNFQLTQSITFLIVFGATVTVSFAQDDEFSETSSEGFVRVIQGKGIAIDFPAEQFTFSLDGLTQPGIQMSRFDEDSTAAFGTYIRRAYLTFQSKDEARGLEAVVRGDLTQASPLLDAYIGFELSDHLAFRAGQFQQPANPREMLFYEGNLAMPERSIVSRFYTATGREFGLAVMGSFGPSSGFIVRPTLAITSGDGINSFGSLSNDPDLGGLKYSGRIDLLPFGDFDIESAVDFERSESPRLAIGLASSYNDGASGPTGESHGDWQLYDATGAAQLPGYLKNVVDILAKFKGVTLLAEYVNAAAYRLDGAYTSAALGTLLMPTEISTLLMLGNAYNVEAGYLFLSGWSIDARFSQTFPEFVADQPASLLQVVDALGGCVTWHVNDQALKLQLSGDYLNYPDVPNQSGWVWTFQTQVQF
jgi:hypothetical protein